jgi:hypothetical protein
VALGRAQPTPKSQRTMFNLPVTHPSLEVNFVFSFKTRLPPSDNNVFSRGRYAFCFSLQASGGLVGLRTVLLELVLQATQPLRPG